MSSASEAKNEVCEELSALNWEVHPYLPQRLNPPAIIIIPDAPYITTDYQDRVFNEMQLNLRAVCIANKVESDAGENTELLDDMVSGVLDECLDAYEVSQPYVTEMQQGSYLTSEVKIRKNI